MTNPDHLRDVTAQLEDIDRLAGKMREYFSGRITTVHRHNQASAANLLDYLALRNRDIRELQRELAKMGLSSLGRTEGHTRAAVHAVLAILYELQGEPFPALDKPAIPSLDHGRKLLRENTDRLFGKAPKERDTRIMVTMPGEFADDYESVKALVSAGMNLARINCAKDDEVTWRKLAAQVRKAAHSLHRTCRIAMDLAGPKLRTGPIERGPKVLTWRIREDAAGDTVLPARIALCPPGHEVPQNTPFDAVMPLTEPFDPQPKPGHPIRFRDRRGRHRTLAVDDVHNGCLITTCAQRAFVEPGTKLQGADGREVAVADFPGKEQALILQEGDDLVLTGEETAGRLVERDEQGRVTRPASIPCSMPELFTSLSPGDPVKFDDGMIDAVVQEVHEDRVRLKITRTAPGGGKLRAQKGINFPGTRLPFSGMMPKDIEDLDAVVELADIVELSFVNEPDDVAELIRELEARDAKQLGIVLKIETRRGFDNLPAILLEALRWSPAGVMIARGDLGVECGWQRMIELQEEILWLCEAAHIPVIWATQVLESLAKTGLPARGELTDAAMAERAECVMLNKGPHIIETVKVLHDILRRMELHQFKKTPTLRSLHVSEVLPGEKTEA